MDAQVAERLVTLSDESSESYAALTTSLVTRIFSGYGPADYAVRLWSGQEIRPEAGMSPRFTLVLNHPGALRRMLLPPTALSLGEALLRNDCDIEGDIVAAMALGTSLATNPHSLGEWVEILRDLLRLPRGPERSQHAAPARLAGKVHSARRDQAAIQYHYDLSNEFYALWLDARMLYSCAYFPTGAETLDAAQEAKLELICRKLRLRPGETLLDIGCGWGALLLYAAQKYGVRGLGVTLSAKQADWARQRIREAGLEHRVRIELRDYRELTGLCADKVVSVGMAEHVGWKQMPAYFARVYQLLAPGGLFLNQAIADETSGAPRSWFSRFFDPSRFFRQYVFPDHELVPLHGTVDSAARSGFEVRDVESLREHYARTARHWLARLEAKQSKARCHVTERTLRVWRLYLAMVAYAFQAARLNVYQVLLAKPGARGESGMPLTRADWYA